MAQSIPADIKARLLVALVQGFTTVTDPGTTVMNAPPERSHPPATSALIGRPSGPIISYPYLGPDSVC
jgi:hypothetical protein